MLKKFGADIGVALYVLTAFIMFIISIPSWLLDIFLAINISLAFTILFTAMFSKEVLDMSYFPTVLLLQQYSESVLTYHLLS